MSAAILNKDSIRQCEAEILRTVSASLHTTCAHWRGSAVAHKDLERVSVVVADHAKRASGAESGAEWKQ
jgi:hypothetical protein